MYSERTTPAIIIRMVYKYMKAGIKLFLLIMPGAGLPGDSSD